MLYTLMHVEYGFCLKEGDSVERDREQSVFT